MHSILYLALIFSSCQRPAQTGSAKGSQKPAATKGLTDARKTNAPRGPKFPAGALDDSSVKWYSKHLKAMKEENLKDQSATTIEAYRFLWLRTWHHPIAVRLENAGGRYQIVVKQLSGKGGYQPGKLVLDSSRELTRDEWLAVTSRISKCGFWEMPTEEQPYVTSEGYHLYTNILDGAAWILEGVRGDQYHIVDRQSPDDSEHRKLGNYREVGLHILEISGLELKDEEIY